MFKKYIYILNIFILFAFGNCTNQTQGVNSMSDKIFMKFISKKSNIGKGIERIDSILKADADISTHKIGLLYYNKAEYLADLNEYDHSFINFKKALVLFEKEGDKKYIGIVNNGLGRVNTTIKEFGVALEQLNTALTIFEELNDKPNELVALDGMAYLHFSQQDYSKAAEIINKLLAINLEQNDSVIVAKNYGNLGYISELLADKKKAEVYYLKAIEINRKIKSKNTTQLQNLGAFYLSINQPEKSKSLYLEALGIEIKKENTLDLKEIYTFLIDSIGTNNIVNTKMFVRKRDSINTLMVRQKNMEKIKLLEDKYKLITKEKELIQKQKDQFNNKVLFLIITGLLLTLGLFLFQKNKNTKLKLKQDKLILEQKVLRSQMNPHFIFNVLTSIQKNMLDEDLLKSSTSLARFAKLIRQNFEFISKELIGLDEDLNALKNYIETQQVRFEDKFDYQINISKGIDLSFIKIPPLLLQPFVENAIEHGLKPKKEKGNLTINVSENKNEIHFEIIDDGVGYKKIEKDNDREHAIDIFFNRLKLRGFGEEKSFSIISENKKGTKIIFSLKL